MIKICGIKNFQAAQAAVESGADMIGFVFAESKRKVSPILAKQIVESVPVKVKKVGVFVDESLDTVTEISDFVGLDYIQLHGDETKEFAEVLNRPIIKAWSIQDKKGVEHFPCDFYLIDSPRGKYNGGNGIAFDWTLVKDLPIDNRKLILAGGLNEKNVIEAIVTVKPAIIDVSSGVETNGEKDPLKIKAFVKAAKQGFEKLKESGK
ncbi:N-(5'-phosphoribosyl)anthranilate isomerase [Heyndrickxia sporothermodurans]|nr:N-(5'-phosphoribosyl)anthranilate isomerase [Heyndrickxia sporothermodurans]